MLCEAHAAGYQSSRFSYSTEVPVVIGGVGGSGTRLIAQCLKELGYFIGSDLNESNDNLLFTLLFKRLEVLDLDDGQFSDLLTIFCRAMAGDRQYTPDQKKLVASLVVKQRNKLTPQWLQARAQALFAGEQERSRNGHSCTWGWKEPSSHVILDRLLKCIPGMKYVHVVRNGLDMAYSENQNQLALWGQHFLGQGVEMTPYFSLKYWCSIHRRVLEIGRSMGDNFLFLNYDDFCTSGGDSVEKLCDFLDVGGDRAAIARQVADLIRVPGSIGRFRSRDISVFDPRDVEYVGQLGFDVGP